MEVNRHPVRRVRRGLGTVLGMTLTTLLATSCAHYTPRWTPQTVAPPLSLDDPRVQLEVARPGEPAESATGAPVSADDAEAAEAAPPESLTLDEAIHLALERNRALEVQSFSPEIVRKSIAEARAAFDPAVSLSASYGEQNSPSAATSGSTGAAAGSTTGTDAGEGTDTTLESALSAIQTLVQQTEELAQILSGDSNVSRSDSFDTTFRVSERVPTGTEFSVSAGVQRAGSSQSADSDYSGVWNIGITQPLLRGFGTQVNLVALRQARNDTAISELGFRDYAMGLVAEVETAYWELGLAQETQRIREFSLELAQRQLDLNQAMIAVGKLSGSARVSAEAEVAAQRSQLVGAQASLEEQSIALWELLNPDSTAPSEFQDLTISLPDIAPVDYAAPESIALARLFRPDLAQSRLDVMNSELSVVAAKNGVLPQLDAFASYGVQSNGVGSSAWRTHLDDTTYDDFEVGLTFSMTLGNRAEKARYQRARLQEEQAEAVVWRVEQTIESEVRKAVVSVQRHAEQIAASEQEVASREKELDIETEQFRLGRSTNLNVLQVQRDLVEAKVAEATARVRYFQAVAALYRSEGTLLTRRGIVLDNEQENSHG